MNTCRLGRGLLMVTLTVVLLSTAAARRANAVSTAFTYQGQLQMFGGPVSATCSMQFKLYDVSAGSESPIGYYGPIAVPVSGGLFSVPLDFPAIAFNGGDRWLEISVDCPGGGGLTVLSPRQQLTASPYALFANSAGSVPDSAVTSAKIADGTIATADLADGAITSAKIANGTISDADIDTSKVQKRVTGTCSSGSAMSTINADGTVACASASVAFAGSGSATTASHSDHDHLGQSWVGSSGTGLRVQSTAAGGIGVVGIANTNTSGIGHIDHAIGVEGSSTDGYGVYGVSSNFLGVYGYSDNNTGVHGQSDGNAGYGVRGIANTGPNARGVFGESTNGTGVYGSSNAASSVTKAGVVGEATNTNGIGVRGVANTGGQAWGVYGQSTSGYAGYFSGHVHVTGTLSGGVKTFKIDHPLDPANKYLYHSVIESPDMKNLYDGTAVLNDSGEAVVTLPNWFEALNQDFRYQLTCIGGFAPVYIAEEVRDNRFRIAGGLPGFKVSWQVTGIRHDGFANAHRVQVEEDKPANERGTYLYPVELGMPPALSVEQTKLSDDSQPAQP